MTKNQHEFSYPVEVARLGPATKRYRLSANQQECVALARRFNILDVQRLDAEVELKSMGKAALVGLKAKFVADVTQACVVSLEPVAEHIEDSFELTYSTEIEEEGQEIVIEAEGDDPPDPIIDGIVDIGEAVAEHLALALDPFPRAEGAEFAAPEPVEEVVETRQNPFAVLNAWKKNGG